LMHGSHVSSSYFFLLPFPHCSYLYRHASLLLLVVCLPMLVFPDLPVPVLYADRTPPHTHTPSMHVWPTLGVMGRPLHSYPLRVPCAPWIYGEAWWVAKFF
jgi:hypothetical protein